MKNHAFFVRKQFPSSGGLLEAPARGCIAALGEWSPNAPGRAYASCHAGVSGVYSLGRK